MTILLKRLYIINWLQKLLLLTIVNYVKELTATQKLKKQKDKLLAKDKNSGRIFDEELKQENLTTKAGFATDLSRFFVRQDLFTGNEDYQNFLVFSSMLDSVTQDNNNQNVINSISSQISPENIGPFGSSLAPIMSNSGNSKVSMKHNNPISVQRDSSSLYNNFILNLHMVYELK